MSRDSSKASPHLATRALAAIGAGAIALYGSRVLINLFGPALPYTMQHSGDEALDSDEFIQFLSLVTGAAIRHSCVRPLVDGPAFYAAQLEAIRKARHTVNVEFYGFAEGRIGAEIVSALAERARAGVEVRVVLDAVGSFTTRECFFHQLTDAGGQMRWYHPVRWNTWQRLNNRTHRKLIIVDGETGFMGGAGVADHWLYSTVKVPRWRDTVFCIEGEAVAGLISAFSENWLEASGEILSGTNQFGFKSYPSGSKSIVVSSTPSGGGTHARILFQALINSARERICITTPYFLPDKSARKALIAAIRERGVRVQILTAGPRIDHPIVRRLSRHSSRDVIRAGAELYEYQPAMMHAKIMTVDGTWNVIGSTNFDHRSFALNDEVNLATLDSQLARMLDQQFEADLQQSERLTLEMIHERTLVGKLELLAAVPLEEEE